MLFNRHRRHVPYTPSTLATNNTTQGAPAGKLVCRADAGPPDAPYRELISLTLPTTNKAAGISAPNNVLDNTDLTPYYDTPSRRSFGSTDCTVHSFNDIVMTTFHRHRITPYGHPKEIGENISLHSDYHPCHGPRIPKAWRCLAFYQSKGIG
jgi:hypothetical protein